MSAPVRCVMLLQERGPAAGGRCSPAGVLRGPTSGVVSVTSPLVLLVLMGRNQTRFNHEGAAALSFVSLIWSLIETQIIY